MSTKDKGEMREDSEKRGITLRKRRYLRARVDAIAPPPQRLPRPLAVHDHGAAVDALELALGVCEADRDLERGCGGTRERGAGLDEPPRAPREAK